MKLRRLNGEGLRRFAEYLDALRATPSLPPPLALLTTDVTSEQVSSMEISPQAWSNRFAAAKWLHETLETARLPDVAADKGLWAWLSLLNFDQVCPLDGRGHRKPGESARHIPQVTNFQRYYRHLLAGPWRIYRTHRDVPLLAMVVLCQPLHTPGELVEQLASRQELVTNRAFLTAATKLYVDSQTQVPKRGSGSKSRGTARRLADVCNQLDVTWDLYAMDADELLSRLPKEFDRFRTNDGHNRFEGQRSQFGGT